ncbi:unnamed protein product [Peniophora sp. CBMAI 1063]|nr:unnamed protein product [Peniophora sp. CBMAI 1063]
MMETLPIANPNTCSPRLRLDTIRDRANELYKKAWGNPWRCETRTSVAPAESTVNAPTTESYQYDCLPGALGQVRRLFLSNSDGADTLVLLHDYEPLSEALTTSYLGRRKGVVVTGHPGIGKTSFLYYLLLQRLGAKCATALQVEPDYFFIFDSEGAAVLPNVTADLRPEEVDVRLAKCWALSDTNSLLRQPCAAFLMSAERVIQAASPGRNPWKDWIKDFGGRVAVMDLPTSKVIGAIVKESGYDPIPSFTYTDKWGPSLRLILDLMGASREGVAEVDEIILAKQATAAAASIRADPTRLSTWSLDAHDGLPFNLVYVCPQRIPLENGDTFWGGWSLTIPTRYLAAIFERERKQVSAHDSPRLLEVLGLAHSTFDSAPEQPGDHHEEARAHGARNPITLPFIAQPQGEKTQKRKIDEVSGCSDSSGVHRARRARFKGKEKAGAFDGTASEEERSRWNIDRTVDETGSYSTGLHAHGGHPANMGDAGQGYKSDSTAVPQPSKIVSAATEADASELESAKARLRMVNDMLEQIHRITPISLKDQRQLAEKVYKRLGPERARLVLPRVDWANWAPRPDVATTTDPHTTAEGPTVAVDLDME